MSSYNMENFLDDFAKRTMANLKYIEDKAKSENLFEVTQLINSMLGLIILPVEATNRVDKITDKKIKDLMIEDYNTIVDLIQKCKSENRFFSDYMDDIPSMSILNLIKHIRNAVAHSGNHGIHFYPISENGQISNIIFYDFKKNQDNNQPDEEFCIKLSVDELKKLVISLSNIFSDDDRFKSEDAYKRDRINDVNLLQKLMKNGKGKRKNIFYKGSRNYDKR